MIKGSVTYRRPKALSRKDIRIEVKAALREIGIEWHRQTLPRHFEENARTRYRYQQRSVAHRKRKLRIFGHQRPLVFTGTMAAAVKKIARIAPTSKGVRVVMKGPKYLYKYVKKAGQPDKAKEITATTHIEERAITNALKTKLTVRLGRIAGTTVTRI